MRPYPREADMKRHYYHLWTVVLGEAGPRLGRCVRGDKDTQEGMIHHARAEAGSPGVLGSLVTYTRNEEKGDEAESLPSCEGYDLEFFRPPSMLQQLAQAGRRWSTLQIREYQNTLCWEDSDDADFVVGRKPILVLVLVRKKL